METKDFSNIDTMIQQYGMTRKEFAAEVGVSLPTVSDWINHKKVPSSKNVAKIAKILDCSPGYVLDLAPLGYPLPGDNNVYQNRDVDDVIEWMHKNPKLGVLFSRSTKLDDDSLDAVIAIVEKINKEDRD